MSQQPKLWTKAFILNTLLNFACYLVFYLLTVIIGSYAMNSYHTSPGIAGILSGIFIVGGFMGRIITGTVIEKIGTKRILYFGLVFFLAMTLLYFITVSLSLLLVVRFFHGMGFGIVSTTCGTIIAQITPHERRGEGIGYYALSVTIASAAGSAIGMFTFEHGSFALILVICAAVIVLSCLAAPFLKVPKMEDQAQAPLVQNQPPDMNRKKRRLSLNDFFEKKAIPISIVIFLVGICYSGIVSFLASFTKQIGLSDIGSLFFIVYALFILLSRPFMGRLFDKRGDNFVIYPCFVLFAAGLVLISMTHTGFVLLAAAAFVGLGYGSLSPCGQAIAVRALPHKRIGLATSTFFGFFDIGIGFGPFLLGMFITTIGYRSLYLCIAAAVIVFMLLYFLLHGRNAHKPLAVPVQPGSEKQ